MVFLAKKRRPASHPDQDVGHPILLPEVRQVDEVFPFRPVRAVVGAGFSLRRRGTTGLSRNRREPRESAAYFTVAPAVLSQSDAPLVLFRVGGGHGNARKAAQ